MPEPVEEEEEAEVKEGDEAAEEWMIEKQLNLQEKEWVVVRRNTQNKNNWTIEFEWTHN